MLNMIKTSLESGLSNKSFCKQQGISDAVFYYWLKRYQQKMLPEEERFIPIQVKTIPALIKEIEICYPNGVRIKIPEGIDVSLLRSLIHFE
jgi:transposase-like protein